MNTRLLLLTLFGLTSAPAWAQPADAPSTDARVEPPPGTSQAAPAPAAPPPPASAPSAAPPAASQSAPSGEPPAPAGAAAPPEGYRSWPAPSSLPPPPPPTYRLAQPRLYPVAAPKKRRYGDAGAPFAIGIGGSMLWRNDRGYELFTSEGPSSAFELFAHYDVLALGNLIVSAGVSLRSETFAGDGGIDLRNNAVQADLMARFRAAGWLWPHLRVGVGVIATRFTLSDELARIEYESKDAALVSTFGAGVTVRTPARLFETYGGRLASLSVGLLIEGGYSLAKAAELEAEPTKKSDVPRATFSLGELERAAPYLRIAGTVRF